MPRSTAPPPKLATICLALAAAVLTAPVLAAMVLPAVVLTARALARAGQAEETRLPGALESRSPIDDAPFVSQQPPIPILWPTRHHSKSPSGLDKRGALSEPKLAVPRDAQRSQSDWESGNFWPGNWLGTTWEPAPSRYEPTTTHLITGAALVHQPTKTPSTETLAISTASPRSPTVGPLSIDLVDHKQACERLKLDTLQLLDMINRGELAAYDLGGVIRFRSSDVSSLALRLAIAA